MPRIIKPANTASVNAKLARNAKPVPVTAAKLAPTKADATKPSGNITRTAATIAKHITAFGSVSDRDNVYIAFYAKYIKKHGGRVTLDQLAHCGERPRCTSNKPHDAGVAVRLSKANLFTYDKATRTIAPTANVLTLASYLTGLKA